MCGIIGFCGYLDAKEELVKGLAELEYRGYDSAGIAVKSEGKFKIFKAKGEIKNLKKIVLSSPNSYMGIGHTRWATHGKPNESNAHPHVSSDGDWVVVHNGIIENYLDLKQKLSLKGYAFYSETDTEVVPKLFEFYHVENVIESINEGVGALKGSYALGVMNKSQDRLYFAKNKSEIQNQTIHLIIEMTFHAPPYVLFGAGCLVAHQLNCLMLLGSPPDMVHSHQLHKTHPSSQG